MIQDEVHPSCWRCFNAETRDERPDETLGVSFVRPGGPNQRFSGCKIQKGIRCFEDAQRLCPLILTTR